MKMFKIIFLFIIFIVICVNAQNKLIKKNVHKFNSKGIWGPGMSMMQAIRDTCSKKNYPDFGKCFVEQMKNFGASDQAVEFAKETGNQGYMRDFKDYGKVDIAFAFYPFRANENQLCFLVNGYPNMIDIDNYNSLPFRELKMNDIYRKIMKNYPNVSIWPGDRSGTEFPVEYNLIGGGQQFIFSYRLQNGCHACALLGFADIAFNFDRHGNYLGNKVTDVIEAKSSQKGSIHFDGYSKSRNKILAKKGAKFNIILNSNRTTGYEWEFAKPIDNHIIKFVGKEYISGSSNIPGIGGKEIWNFITKGTGQENIIFKYLRPWEKHKKPAKVDTFHILVR